MVNKFDTSRLIVRSAVDRKSRIYRSDAKEGLQGVPTFPQSQLAKLEVVRDWLRNRKGPSVWFMGGHVFKANVDWYIEKLRPCMTYAATNGAGLVHQWEMIRLGHTSEAVPVSIKDGSFGMWSEIGEINSLITRSPELGIGGIFSWREDPPTTYHIAVGQDVFCMHPNYNPEAWGRAAYIDFLKFVSVVEGMEDGTLLVFGSAVCAPEVFLKALGMARNANNGRPHNINVAVFDSVALPTEFEAKYQHRPLKTLMGRLATQSIFIHGRHEDTIPNLWKLLCT